MPAASQSLSSNKPHRNQHTKCPLPDPRTHSSSDDNDTSLSSLEQSRDHQSNLSNIPINRHRSQLHLTSLRSYRRNNDIDDVNKDYFSPNQRTSSGVSIDFKKRVHGIYVLPVSPTLSSSSSMTNTDEIIKSGSNTMPNLSRKHLSSLAGIHNGSTHCGIQNDCFTESPKAKDRILRYIQPPSQPPPLPPTIPQVPCNNVEKLIFQYHSTLSDANIDAVALHFKSMDENPKQKKLPPPVPSRSQKPSLLAIDLEELANQSDTLTYRFKEESSPQDDFSEHTWPKPPESMSASGISVHPSIPYDHLLPTIIVHQNSTKNAFHQYRHEKHIMFADSDTK